MPALMPANTQPSSPSELPFFAPNQPHLQAAHRPAQVGELTSIQRAPEVMAGGEGSCHHRALHHRASPSKESSAPGSSWAHPSSPSSLISSQWPQLGEALDHWAEEQLGSSTQASSPAPVSRCVCHCTQTSPRQGTQQRRPAPCAPWRCPGKVCVWGTAVWNRARLIGAAAAVTQVLSPLTLLQTAVASETRLPPTSVANCCRMAG